MLNNTPQDKLRALHNKLLVIAEGSTPWDHDLPALTRVEASVDKPAARHIFWHSTKTYSPEEIAQLKDLANVNKVHAVKLFKVFDVKDPIAIPNEVSLTVTPVKVSKEAILGTVQFEYDQQTLRTPVYIIPVKALFMTDARDVIQQLKEEDVWLAQHWDSMPERFKTILTPPKA